MDTKVDVSKPWHLFDKQTNDSVSKCLIERNKLFSILLEYKPITIFTIDIILRGALWIT